MNGWKIHVACAVSLLAAAPATGASLESREKVAKKACLVGDVSKGTEILADLYVRTDDPVYIYNQGRCFEQNGKNDQAVLRFKEYLRKDKGIDSAARDAVLKKIEELQPGNDSKPQPPAPEPAANVRASEPASPKLQTAPVAPSPEPGSSEAPLLGTLPVEASRPGVDTLAVSTPPSSTGDTPPIYKRWWFLSGVGAVVVGGVVTAILLTRGGAAQSPACDGAGICVP
jgi:hypothetical protein